MEAYRNTRNNRVAVLDSVFEKSGTVTLVFMDDGKSTCISPSTFKRWYKKIEIDDPETKVETKVESKVTEEPVVEESPVVEEKKDSEPKKRKPYNTTPRVGGDREYMEDLFTQISKEKGFDTVTYEKIKHFILFKLGKTRLEIRFGLKQYSVNIKEDYVPKDIEYVTVKNYYLPAQFKVGYGDSRRDVIFAQLLTALEKDTQNKLKEAMK